MKKVITYLITIIISAIIPVYFLLIWEPLKSKEVISEGIISNEGNYKIEKLEDERELIINNEELNDGIFSKIDELPQDKHEKLNALIKDLSIVDIIKINNYFYDISNNKNVKEALDLIERRMSKEKYEEFKNIIKDYINLEENA